MEAMGGGPRGNTWEFREKHRNQALALDFL